jgi:hypothetical protein
VKAYLGVLRQEFFYRFGLVGRKYVEHDVNCLRPSSLANQLPEKGDEPGAGWEFWKSSFTGQIALNADPYCVGSFVLKICKALLSLVDAQRVGQAGLLHA